MQYLWSRFVVPSAIVLGMGCGTVGRATPGDAGSPGADAASDADAAPMCDFTTPFGAASPVGGVNSFASEINAQLSPDERRIYLASTRRGTYDLFEAVRSSRSLPFEEPIALTTVNTEVNEEGPSVSQDGKTLYFASNRSDDTGGFDIYTTTRTALDPAGFVKAEIVQKINSQVDDATPFISADQQTLYFNSTGTGGVAQIFRAVRPSPAAQFSAATEVPGLAATDGQESNGPVISFDDRALYFGSLRGDGKGSIDIWVARRSMPTDGFGAATNVSELNTLNKEWPLWVSPDGCRLYFASDRPPSEGYDIYMAEKPAR